LIYELGGRVGGGFRYIASQHSTIAAVSRPQTTHYNQNKKKTSKISPQGLTDN